MRGVLMVAISGLALAACAGASPAPREAAPAAPQGPPRILWDSTGKGSYIYHNVWGDCDFLAHGHGRNNAWGLWRLPLGAVRTDGVASDGNTGFEIRYTCKDGSACIQAGQLEETPARESEHTIPFGSQERAEQWLSQAAGLEAACAAAR